MTLLIIRKTLAWCAVINKHRIAAMVVFIFYSGSRLYLWVS
jgi:hypothetical protein